MIKYYYRGTINATALEPALLDPVDEILLVRVVSVVDNEGPEAAGGLALDPVLEDEAEDAAGHLQQQQDGEEDRVGGQQGRVLPQRPDTANKCCNLNFMYTKTFKLVYSFTNDKGYGTSPDEDKGWVQGYVCKFGQVIERVLLGPGPNPNSQDSKAKKLQQQILSFMMFFTTTFLISVQ